MKTHKNLYPQIYDFENLYQAYRKARRGKRRREQAYRFEFDLESNLLLRGGAWNNNQWNARCACRNRNNPDNWNNNVGFRVAEYL